MESATTTQQRNTDPLHELPDGYRERLDNLDYGGGDLVCWESAVVEDEETIASLLEPHAEEEVESGTTYDLELDSRKYRLRRGQENLTVWRKRLT